MKVSYEELERAAVVSNLAFSNISHRSSMVFAKEELSELWNRTASNSDMKRVSLCFSFAPTPDQVEAEKRRTMLANTMGPLGAAIAPVMTNLTQGIVNLGESLAKSVIPLPGSGKVSPIQSNDITPHNKIPLLDYDPNLFIHSTSAPLTHLANQAEETNQDLPSNPEIHTNGHKKEKALTPQDKRINQSHTGGQPISSQAISLKYLKNIEKPQFYSNKGLLLVNEAKNQFNSETKIGLPSEKTSPKSSNLKPKDNLKTAPLRQDTKPQPINRSKTNMIVDQTRGVVKKAKMPNLDDLEDQSQQHESEDDADSYDEDTYIEKQLRNTNPTDFEDCRAQLMVRIYKSSATKQLPGVKIPCLDASHVSEFSKGKISCKEFEQTLLDAFSAFANYQFKGRQKMQSYFAQNFASIYKKYVDKEEKIVNFVMNLLPITEKAMLEIAIPAPSIDQSMSQSPTNAIHGSKHNSGAKDSPLMISPSDCGKSIFTENSPCSSKIPPVVAAKQMNNWATANVQTIKIRQIEPLAPKIKPVSRTYKDRVEITKQLLKEEVRFDINQEKKYVSNIDDYDQAIDNYNRSAHASPTKSTRSTATKRKRRGSGTSTILHQGLIKEKNPLMMNTLNFNMNLQKNVRPIYIFDEDCMDRLNHLLTHLILSEQEKFLVKEIIYFKEDLIIDILKEFMDATFCDVYLKKVRSAIKKYKKIDKKSLKQKLSFEDTVVYLNKVCILSNKGALQIGNMFKYNNEMIFGIYESFILNKDFSDFCENLCLFQNSKHNQKPAALSKYNQEEKSYKLLLNIDKCVMEVIHIYFTKDERNLLTKMINEANEELVKFITQNEHLMKKHAHSFSMYSAFNYKLKLFMEKAVEEMNKKKVRKHLPKFQQVPEEVMIEEREENKPVFEQIMRSEKFRVG